MLTAYDARTLRPIARRAVEGAGALCAWGGDVMCAAEGEGGILRLDGNTLAVRQRLPAGPGIRALRVGADGLCLYALAGDADSVLLLDGESGAPQVLARVGVQPRNMALDSVGNTLAVAGGADCCVYLLRGDTLATLARIDVDGVAVSVAFAPGALWVLCAVGQEDLATSLLRVQPGSGKIERRLDMEGMPGGLLALPDAGVVVGLLDGMAYVARHAKRVGWRVALDGALPDSAAHAGRHVFWADGLGGCVWALDWPSARMRPCLQALQEPVAVLLI
jgi:hypothetical protein